MSNSNHASKEKSGSVIIWDMWQEDELSNQSVARPVRLQNEVSEVTLEDLFELPNRWIKPEGK